MVTYIYVCAQRSSTKSSLLRQYPLIHPGILWHKLLVTITMKSVLRGDSEKNEEGEEPFILSDVTRTGSMCSIICKALAIK